MTDARGPKRGAAAAPSEGAAREETKHATADALRLSEAKLASIVDISSDAIISMDDERNITLFNKGAERMFGYRREEIIGRSLDLLLPDRLRAVHQTNVARFASGAVSTHRTGTIDRPVSGLRKDGTEFPADVAISKVEVDGVRTFTATLRDITEERRSAEEQAFLSEAGTILASTLDYEETLAQVATLAVRHFTDVCVVEVLDEQDELRRLRAVARDPSLGWACDVIAKLQLDRSRPYLATEALATRTTVCMDTITDADLVRLSQTEDQLRALRAMGVSSAIVVPLVARDVVLGALCFLASTEARRHRSQDLRLAEGLALRAANAIDNARLYRTAQRAVRARDEVLGIVAHDLRNPLSAVLMQAQLLRPRLVDPDQRTLSAIDSIRRAVVRMNRMIEDLLDATRMEAGRLAVDLGSVAPSPLVADVIEAQRPLATAASIELVAEAHEPIPEVLADRDRLQQILENLIGNAIKFTAGGGRVTVRLSAGPDEVVFAVADNGTGIAAEDLPHVFDRFWQGKREGQRGAGLGLQIVKGLVEAHGGRIWVDSAVGAGTTFSFALRAAPSSSA